MTLRRLETMQWLGLLLGAVIFGAQLVVGFGITQAECGVSGGGRFGIDNDVWQSVLLGISTALVLAAEASAVAVFLGTRRTTYEDPPPDGRVRFLAIAAMAANVIFLIIIVLSGLASILGAVCRQA
jgi:hypothetical protein